MRYRRSATTLFLAVTVVATSSASYADPLSSPATASADWDGYRVALHPASAPTNLDVPTNTRWVGMATNFQATDPALSCLNGSDLQVYAPSSPFLGSTALLTFQLSNFDLDCVIALTTDLTWVAEPTLFLAEKAARMSKAADDGDNDGHAPRIDLYLTDGYGAYSPCTREVLSDNSKKYVCRTITYQTTTIPTVSPNVLASVAVDYGEASGGGGYSIYTTAKRVYEGCDVRNEEWVCSAYASNISNKSFATQDKWVKNAYAKWADEQSFAVQCTAAIYTQDAQAIAEDCIPMNYLRWVNP